MSLEHHIEAIQKAETAEEAFDKFVGITTQYGYEKVVYSLLTDHPSLSLPKQSGLISSYPEDWVKYYQQQGYFPRDPVVYGAFHCRLPFYWEDLRHEKQIAPEDMRILDYGAEAGVKKGIGIPLFGLGGEVVGLGLASDTDHMDQNYEILAQLYLLANMFHQKYRQLLTQSVITSITQKEKDVLSWAAESKTDEEIGILMNISVHTVRYHWKNIFKKMQAYGRYVAISKAITMGIIQPRYVMTDYQSW